MKSKKIAVVGAGISGLTCAYELQKAGHQVVVFEKESSVGGRMSTRTKDGFPMDIGANHLANVYTHMREMATELELEWKPMEFLNYRILSKEAGTPATEADMTGLIANMSKASQKKLAWQGFWGTRKRTDFFNLNTAANYDTDTCEHYSVNKIGQEAYDHLIDPFISTYQFHRGDEISLGVVYAMMRTHYKDKDDWALQQITGGMIALPQALADKLEVQLETPVTSVEPVDSGVIIKTATGEQQFDLAVLASTANITEKIYPSATKGQKAVLQGTRYATTVGVGFKVPKDTLGDITIAWIPYVKGGAISGFTNEAMKGEALIQNGKTLLLTWFHEDFAKKIIDNSDEEIFAIAKKELVKVCPYVKQESLLENHDLQRWSHAMPKYYQGSLKLVETFLQHHQGEQNVFFCGDFLNAPWTEGALRCGQRVAADICSR